MNFGSAIYFATRRMRVESIRLVAKTFDSPHPLTPSYKHGRRGTRVYFSLMTIFSYGRRYAKDAIFMRNSLFNFFQWR